MTLLDKKDNHLLLVEDSKSIAFLIRTELQKRTGIEVSWAKSLAEAQGYLSGGDRFFLSILDLTLPDAPNGEIVDIVLSNNIPAIVFAGKFSKELRDSLWQRMVVDYVLKDSPNNIDYLVTLVHRIQRNKDIKVLVVDDSKSSLLEIANLLTIHQYNVFPAADPWEALAILAEHPDIRMVITDYYMPVLNGLELTKQLRKKYDRNTLAVIGMSSDTDNALAAQFIKRGANDFLRKPFSSEEFYCRIGQNIDLLEYIQQIKESSNRDFLTGLYNRRYFFEMGRKLLASARRGHITLTAALLDIDHFKLINDRHGHDAGDLVLRQLGNFLQTRFRETDVVCRYGGEEFCVLCANMAVEQAIPVFERVRESIAEIPMNLGEGSISITVSIGLCIQIHEKLEEMISAADANLYRAKDAGRNRVVA